MLKLLDECMIEEHGNCQHVLLGDDGWIIPSGIHCFFGRTVGDSIASDLVATKNRRDELWVERTWQDDLGGELQRVFDEAKQEASKKALDDPLNNDFLEIFEKKLMIRLAVLCVERDRKAFEHGYKLGREER